MPINREEYLRLPDEQISAQKRRETDRPDVSGAMWLAGTVGFLLLARKKATLTRALSDELKFLGRSFYEGTKRYTKYIVAGKNVSGLPPVVRALPRWVEEILKPIPSAAEQLTIGIAKTVTKQGTKFLTKIPTLKEAGLTRWSRLDTFFRGPAVSAIAPGVSLGAGGITSGAKGGLVINRAFHQIDEFGNIGRIIHGVSSRMTSLGGRSDVAEQYLHKNLRHFVRHSFIPSRKVGIAAEQRTFYETYLRKQLGKVGVPVETGRDLDYLKKLADRSSMAFPSTQLISPYRLFREQGGAIEDAWNKTFRQLLHKAIRKPGVKGSYWFYKKQIDMGIGFPYASHGSGVIGRAGRALRKASGGGIRHPKTGIPYIVEAPRYISPEFSKSGIFEKLDDFGFPKKVPAPFFPEISIGKIPGAARRLTSFTTGTLWKTLEELTGIGVTGRGTALSRKALSMFGAGKGSFLDHFFNAGVMKMMRFLGYGMGAYYGFKTVNYLARRTTGWSPIDLASKAYVSAREFQQKVLQDLGLIDAARTAEETFPGLTKSPAAMVLSKTAPFWMAAAGKYGIGPTRGWSIGSHQIFPGFKLTKPGGIKGGRIGLALGIALALITWGNISQSPEELHRIYTGEQDIPVRRGRWWLFGRTPFGGGKIKYWRPHWYPLMKSGYRHKGQLWESETEEMAQGTALSPILAPLLTGKAWDPYYWEKKHYKDRPYPLTGELFEPTMPFAPFFNATIGELIKPQRIMHPEYWGEAGVEPGGSPRDMVEGAGEELGLGTFSPEGKYPAITPDDPRWRATQAMYNLTERMGLRGYMLQQMTEKITGRPDFLQEGPIVQSARRATGFERAYWEMEIGDPGAGLEGGITEFFRRILPHRRRGIEEYNPIENQMPDWLPGPDYYIDFRHGDPYIKIPFGEARLPGAGYESLHRLHSGIPRTYDAVDRFLILADIAPYSDEYKHYRYLAKAMTREDPTWSERVQRKIEQRSATQQEYDFLDLEPPEDLPDPLKSISSAYRRALAGFTTLPLPHEIVPFLPTVQKVLPYKTAIGTYKDYRLYGGDFTAWSKMGRDFVLPWARKTRGMFDQDFIPESELERREYDEYFDKLKYVKHMQLSTLAEMQGENMLAKKFSSIARKTLTGINPYNRWGAMTAMPKRERAFFDAFIEAREEDREQILDMVPESMQKLYKAQWNTKDKKAGLPKRYDVSRTTSRDVVDYYREHHLPAADWVGWHPDVNLRDVQLKVVKQEAMDIHGFNLWESQERALRRRPYVPTIDDIYEPTREVDLSGLQNMLYDEFDNQGFNNSRIFITRTPADINSVNMRFNIKRNRIKEYSRVAAKEFAYV